MDRDSKRVIKQWLDDLAYSAATWDIDAHMALVSEKVVVLGIAGVDKIDYAGWRKRRHNEFKNRRLRSLHYREPQLLTERPQLITFSVQELIKDNSNQSIEVDKEVTLQQEQDGQWRVIREQILNIDAAGYKLLS